MHETLHSGVDTSETTNEQKSPLPLHILTALRQARLTEADIEMLEIEQHSTSKKTESYLEDSAYPRKKRSHF